MNAPDTPPTGPRRMRMRDGGWLIAVTALVCLALLAWAFAGVLRGHRPKGDGHTIESYGFDLSALRTGGGALVASGNPRDFLPALDAPSTIAGFEMLEYNAKRRDKYVVTDDRVVGVVVGGKARAYPVQVLNVHEVVNDTLGGVPIAVTFSPLCDAAVAFDRRVEGVERHFGVSGLLLDSNLVMYDRGDKPSLWSQLGMCAIAGPAAARGARLEPLPGVQTCTWKHWLATHPDTEVILPDGQDARRIKNTSYSRYLLSGRLDFPVARWNEPGAMPAKTPVIVVRRGADSRELTLADAARGMEPFQLGDAVVEVDAQASPASVLFRTRDGSPLVTVPCLHFAWFAFHQPPATPTS
jgi:hypothetical protein